MKNNKLNKYPYFLLILLILSGCSERPRSESLDKYMTLVKNNSYAINLFYKNPSVENYSKVKNLWLATPDEMMEEKGVVEHTAKIFYVFSKMVEDKYGYDKIKLDAGNWTSASLCSAFFDETKRNCPLEMYLNPKIISVDTLDYNWAAYSVTGDVKYSNFIKFQFNSVNSIVSGAAKWSYDSMSKQDNNLEK
jgi:hypothetical protein